MAKIDTDQRLHKYQIDYDTAIQELNDAKQAENIAVFIGAGISKFVEPKYPIWNEVTAKLRHELPNCTTNDALDIAQAYSDQFGETRLAETVSSLFPDYSSNIDFYRELLKCRPKYLITTNWDNMLQKTIESEAYMYDTIADDKELMDSKLFNKYIKMHGDFQHKFVLTRSSYNSYSKNYPLIENFVKSILCTHTVVFMGYSLSDEDFKHILDWIKMSAPAEPKFYCAFAVEHYNEDSASKFNSRGIKTFKVQDFTQFFTRLNDSNNELQNKNPIHAFAGLLAPLCKDKFILLSSLRSFISNCSFKYVDEYRSYLELFTNELTGDYNKYRRDFFNSLIKTILDKNIENSTMYSDGLQIIHDVFKKTGILGITYNGYNKILPVEYSDKSFVYTTFNYEIHDEDSEECKVQKLYTLSSIDDKEVAKKALDLNFEIIKSDIKSKNYRKLLISYFNQNTIIRVLNVGIPISKAIEYIDIERKYLTFPSIIQAEISDIYNFITENTLRDTIIILSEAIESIKDRLNSFVAIDIDRFRWSAEHKNLNDFVFLNHILIENNALFRKVQQLYVEIAVLRKTVQKPIILNKNEIFSCIHYFDYHKNNYSLDNLFFENKVELKFEQVDEDWLVNIVLPNCIKMYKQNKPYNSKLYLCNLLCICSYALVSVESIIKIINSIEEIIRDCICNGDILKQINNFIGFQYNKSIEVFKNKSFLPVFKCAVNKYLKQCASPEEQMAFAGLGYNYYEIFYKIAKANKEKFEDVEFLKKIINSFENAVFDAKIICYIKILMPFYLVGNDGVKKYLKSILLDFLNNIPTQPVPSQFGGFEFISLLDIEYYRYWYELKLIEIGLKLGDSTYVQNLEAWLTKIYDQEGTSSMISIIHNEILLLKENNQKFDNAMIICKKIIEKHTSYRILQI
ncbi:MULTISPECIES: SIR2 family protein [Treponema]|uniref:SIR2 family protein n=1 Tax=Treponema TaxID=157 RepID=UPI0002B52E25|nr:MULTISPECIES: SIR2 family protein [Treponema]EMB42119.1 hypothetical protein HMPREF9729_02565 [Treponema denticola ASLM]EMB42295.1 hypothetical protein HMPREF9729_02559 [Treponema denticola ASLM]EMD56309.1 hypothetical protein HMPREF9728_01763 [Treponema denticola US-Trep]UTD09778.1 SIR2 family protein [Treponema sp. B152]